MLRTVACASFLLLLAACANGTEAIGPSGNELLPYQTGTASPSPTIIPVLTRVILPTPTQFIYTIQQNDTLSGIASRHGVSLEALIAANPGVQPNSLSVGQSLIIPTGNELPGEPTPTPAPLTVTQVRCWPEPTGGLWCFGLVTNEYPQTVENLSAQISLLDGDGEETASQTAYGLLDILPPGAGMPLAAHFPPPVDSQAVARMQLLTAIRLLPGDTRYLPVMLENTLVEVDTAGKTARVSGQVVMTGSGLAETVWVLATAYDIDGNVVGVRRWEAETALNSGTPLRFDFLVSSQGPGIARVEFLVEARP